MIISFFADRVKIIECWIECKIKMINNVFFYSKKEIFGLNYNLRALDLDYHNFFSLNINSLDHLVKYKEIKRFFQFT